MLYSVAQKSITHYQIIKQIVLNCIKVCHEISIKYSLRDLLFDVNSYDWPTK